MLFDVVLCGANNLKILRFCILTIRRANAERRGISWKLCSDLGVEFVHGKAESVPEAL
ncbi:MAG: hypothetical protein ACLUKN_11460 [Bacilli bacterium]